ncbi:unnamed protein product, partial [Ectocarpus sp. 12 AP-2014]
LRVGPESSRGGWRDKESREGRRQRAGGERAAVPVCVPATAAARSPRPIIFSMTSFISTDTSAPQALPSPSMTEIPFLANRPD